MKKIIHILGSEIPHHNQTVLQFFAQQLVGNHCFYVVGQRQKIDGINCTFFSKQIHLAKAMIAKNRQDRSAYFVLHGQFNVWIWLVVLFGLIEGDRCYWHIWGADLYQEAKSWKFRLFYPLRRMAQRKLKAYWGTLGDLDFAQRLLGRKNLQTRLLYFPTRLGEKIVRASFSSAEPMRILVGNSGDRANRHLQALEQIRLRCDDSVKLVIPMGYPKNNQQYIQQVKKKAESLFRADQIEIIEQPLDFVEYQSLLASCDLAYFAFKRQQGIGTICLCIQQQVPFILDRENPFTQDLLQEDVPFLYQEEWQNGSQIVSLKQQLAELDLAQLGFFPQKVRERWQTVLKEMEDDE